MRCARHLGGRGGIQSNLHPLGQKPCLRNPGKVPLAIIKVQSGRHLGEDDILRFDNSYGRS